MYVETKALPTEYIFPRSTHLNLNKLNIKINKN